MTNPLLAEWQAAAAHWTPPENCTISARVPAIATDSIIVEALLNGTKLAMHVSGAELLTAGARQAEVKRVQQVFEDEAHRQTATN